MKKVLCLMLSIIFSINFVACKSAPKPDDTVNGYFEAGKSLDTSKMNSFVNPKNVKSESSSSETSSNSKEADLQKYCMDYLKKNAKKLTYSIKNVDTKDDTAVVTVECKYVDGSPILREAISEYAAKAIKEAFSGSANSEDPEKEISQILTDKMKTTTETYTDKTIKINCIKTNDKWYIDKVNNDLEDVFVSGFISAMSEISKSFSNFDPSKNDSASSSMLLPSDN